MSKPFTVIALLCVALLAGCREKHGPIKPTVDLAIDAGAARR